MPRETRINSAAIITIRHPDRMTKRGASEIAKWMRKSAGFLERYHKDMASVMRYRYIGVPP